MERKKMYRKIKAGLVIVGILGMFFVSVIPVFAQSTIEAPCIADTWVNNRHFDWNTASWLKFDITALSGKTIESAILVIYPYQAFNGYDLDVQVMRITDQSWVESASPSTLFGLTKDMGQIFEGLSLGSKTNLDITNIVVVEQGLGHNYVSLILEDPDKPLDELSPYSPMVYPSMSPLTWGGRGYHDDTGVYLHSREFEYAEYRPVLRITYTDVIPPALLATTTKPISTTEEPKLPEIEEPITTQEPAPSMSQILYEKSLPNITIPQIPIVTVTETVTITEIQFIEKPVPCDCEKEMIELYNYLTQIIEMLKRLLTMRR
jgi:hypothetical protein